MRKLFAALIAFVVIGVALAMLTPIIWRPAAAPPGPSGPPSTFDRPLLIIGEEWPPFEYMSDGKVVGIDVELFDIIFKRLGVKHEVKLYPWSRAKLMAENGETDLLVSISFKTDRESYLLFTESQREFDRSGVWPSEYLWRSEYFFFCRKLNADKFKFESYAQLAKDGYRIGTVRDYSYNPDFLNAQFDPIVAPDFPNGMKMLLEGKIDLFPADKTIGLACAKELGLDKDITFLPKPLFSKPYFIPFCKKSPYPQKEWLLLAIYSELEKLRADGTYQAIFDKYVK